MAQIQPTPDTFQPAYSMEWWDLCGPPLALIVAHTGQTGADHLSTIIPCGTILLVSLIFDALMLLWHFILDNLLVALRYNNTPFNIIDGTVPTATNGFIKQDGRHLFGVMLAPLKTLFKFFFFCILVPFCGPWLQPLAGIMRSWSAQSLNWGRAWGKM